jgi:sec-independent protein translocase protein TatC
MLPKLLPDLYDLPMSLGDHLHELRRRLVLPIACIVVVFIGAMAFQAQLKLLLVRPLQWGLALLSAEELAKLGVAPGTDRLLTSFSLGESTMLSMAVAMDAAIALTIPVVLWQLWAFVATGLKASERRLAFLFVPFGVILFYLGAMAGYFWGLPYMFAWLIQWEAGDPVAARALFGMSLYHELFLNLTVCFGLVMDIPWAVMVLVRVGFVSVAQFGRLRRFIAVINLVLAAMITPTSDLFSLMVMFVPMQLLFEGGLLASRAMMWMKARREARGGR